MGKRGYYISDVIDGLDLSAFHARCAGGGSRNQPYHPAMMVKVLAYGYASGVFSSRKLARKLHEDVAFRVLAAGNYPAHHTICDFRAVHLNELADLFVPTVSLVRKCGCTVGNQTDVQNDIHDWYLKLFEGYVDNKRIPDIPPALSQAFTAVWREAMSAATSTFDAERQSLEARERIATTECEAALALKDETARQLETAESSVADLKQQVSEQQAAVAARNDRIQALTVANVENELGTRKSWRKSSKATPSRLRN